MLDSFSNKQALITGGASGIGRAIARALCRQECAVTVTGLTKDEINTFSRDEPDIAVVPLEVSDGEAIERLIAGMGELDILINAAGMILRDGREFEPVQFARVVDVNLTGMMRMCVACRPLLAHRRGCIVNVASMLSYFGSGYAPAYSASKGGVVQLTKSLAIAWAKEGIRVNAIAPGWIRTPLTEPLVADAERSRAIVERTPLGRWGEPDDVAGAALFLCSPEAAFITGVTLPVDGGYLIA